MKQSVAITVNGVQREDAVEARLLLVHYLREVAGLTGTHIACDTSQCGACTVLVDGRAVKSCTVFAVQADSSSVTTVEGIATGSTLHPVQQAFWDEHGLQCGFCTPGFVMATAALLDGNPSPTDDEIRKGLEGNLCRCTGYANIMRAVRSAAAAMHGTGEVRSTATPAGAATAESKSAATVGG
ncbi:MAG TPA: (2Fe-2S)-binding protein [Candidatus Dormibacteraeota bacterium]|nr:(2Fe-2S)-binding protein [Candidatus Dormibacteraeota bacterium]